MNRLMRGSVVLAAVLGVTACAGDPFEGDRGEVARVVANPTSLFMDLGETQPILVEAVDESGAQVAADFEFDDDSPGIAVVRDRSFNPTNGGEPINTRARLVVTADQIGSHSFTVTAGGQTLTIPVRVMPTALDATVSNAAPQGGEAVTLTAPSGLVFAPGTTVTFATGEAIVVSNTGTDLTFIATPGAGGDVEVTGVEASFLPGVPLTLPLTTAITVGSTPVTLPGTDAQGTAPTIAAPAAGETAGVIDAGGWAGDCGGVPCQWYRLDVTEEGSYAFHATWDNTSDLGVYVVQSDGATGVDACDAHGNGADAQPEECSMTLAAGTYYIQMQNFAPFYPDPDPTWFALSILHE